MPKVQEGEPPGGGSQGELPLGKGERVLFVDDEPSLVEAARRMLELLGYRVKAFTDPKEALSAFLEDPQGFDLLVADLTMPQMTGDALARELLEVRPDLPVIICTGYSDRLLQVAKLGIKAVLPKPLSLGSLAEAVRKALKRTS